MPRLAMVLLFVAAPAAAAPSGMVAVEGGAFVRGSARGEPDERPKARLNLKAFHIDRHEVTQAEYARCVADHGCRPARRHPGCVGAKLPVVGVSWHDAVAFCRWAGKRLPTEAEWERAARGVDGRTYPWGEKLDCGRGNFGNFAGAGPCASENPGRILPPGSRPAGVSPIGAHDMAGNVWEWTADPYRSYRTGKLSGPVEHRVVRGGSCCSYFAMPRASNRLSFPATYQDRDIGFRCAASEK